jgi:hypothetical protein
MEKSLLSLGSVVYLKGGTQKTMIIGRGVIYQEEETNSEFYLDYMGCVYPEGVDPDLTIYFNHENIDQILFEGYIDDEEERFMKVYEQWENCLTIPKKHIY